MSIAELRSPHDASFKHFVWNPEFVRPLLRARPLLGLDEAEVVETEQARSNLIHPDLSQRVVDAAWKLTLRDGGLVYLLVECQSTPDPSMPFRILNAVSALYLYLSRNPPGDGRYSAKRVPCVKHLTVYSGRAKWNVAEDVSKLVEAGAAGPGPEVPRIKCEVLDLRRWESAEGGRTWRCCWHACSGARILRICAGRRSLCGIGWGTRSMRSWRVRSRRG